MPRQDSTPKKAAFLAAYTHTCSITKAAEAAQMDRGTHYFWLASDPGYKARFEATKETAVETLEDEAVRRAYHGVERPMTVAGKRELVKEYSDTLLIFLLKAARPGKYRDNYNVHVEGALAVGILEQAIARGRERAEAASLDVKLIK
jgi:hypothetical protein